MVFDPSRSKFLHGSSTQVLQTSPNEIWYPVNVKKTRPQTNDPKMSLADLMSLISTPEGYMVTIKAVTTHPELYHFKFHQTKTNKTQKNQKNTLKKTQKNDSNKTASLTTKIHPNKTQIMTQK